MGTLTRKLQRWRFKTRKILWKMRRRFTTEVTVDTRQGRLTVFTSDQTIGQQLYIHREFESQWVDTALRFLRTTQRLPDKGRGTVLDIGANLGVISIGLLHDREFEQAIAIEPDPRNFALLERNARQNQLSAERYVCLPCAASERRGEAELELSGDNYGDHRVRAAERPQRPGLPERYREDGRQTIRVRMDTLDQLLAGVPAALSQAIALVWIDTQGHEGYVFSGGRELFSRDIPVVTEFWPYGIARSGMSQERFCEIVSEYWAYYWVWRRGKRFLRYPISSLDNLFEEVGDDGDHDNIVLTK